MIHIENGGKHRTIKNKRAVGSKTKKTNGTHCYKEYTILESFEFTGKDISESRYIEILNTI